MSNRVRCAECSKFANGRCVSKDSKVAAKKWRSCSIYDFAPQKKIVTKDLPKVNISPWHFMSKKEKKLLQRLVDAGVSIIPANPNMTAAETVASHALAGIRSTAGYDIAQLQTPSVGSDFSIGAPEEGENND